MYAFFFPQVRTFPYLPVQRDDRGDSRETWAVSYEARVPFDVLVSLHNHMPKSDIVLGDFGCVALRVKGLYKATVKWQNDISSCTSLSLRGTKRRLKTASDDTDTAPENSEAFAKVEVEKIELLSKDPILSKVSTPRTKRKSSDGIHCVATGDHAS